jgi:hypothetical protein
MPVPDFSPGEVLTAAAMDSIGMWKIGTVTSGSTTAIVVDNVFSTDYTNYRLVGNVQSIDLAARAGRLELINSAGTTISADYFTKAVSWSNNASVTAIDYDNTSAAMSYGFIGPDTNNIAGFSLDIYNPADAQHTGMSGSSMGHLYGTAYVGSFCSSVHAANTVMRGFRLRSSTGNIKGTVTVYGYRK